jgi:hypothetical protein
MVEILNPLPTMNQQPSMNPQQHRGQTFLGSQGMTPQQQALQLLFRNLN